MNGRLVQVINERGYFNFDRFRRPSESRPADEFANQAPTASNGIVIDAATHAKDLDTNGLWEENFGGHADKKPFGKNQN